ncbi:MAG: isomerase [Desulfobacterium sp.]|nr:isomerase [Desulfobacterium sp.]
MRLDIYQVDAFTDRLYAGNPAAVVLCENELSAKLMQSIAAENNLAETAFVIIRPDRLAIRWFTPTVEVDLCGHATLAAAHVLFDYQGVAGSLLSFESRSGTLRVHKIDDVLWLDFPTDRFVREDAIPEGLINGLGIEPRELYRGRDDYLAILDSEDYIRDLSLDQAALAALARLPVRGVIVSAQGNEVDFISRFFAPQCGIPEDPVTGSAHTTLIPYWSKRLGKKKMTARQLSARGGTLLCEDHGDRVMIGGSAVMYLKGEIYV